LNSEKLFYHFSIDFFKKILMSMIAFLKTVKIEKNSTKRLVIHQIKLYNSKRRFHKIILQFFFCIFHRIAFPVSQQKKCLQKKYFFIFFPVRKNIFFNLFSLYHAIINL